MTKEMKRVFFILFIGLFLFSVSCMLQDKVIAQELREGRIRDPFKTWLPKKAQKSKREDADSREKIEKIKLEEEIVLPDFIIQGLIWNTDFPQAIINDFVVKIGDIIDEAKILDISKEGIKIFYKEKEFFIKAQLSIAGSKETR